MDTKEPATRELYDLESDPLETQDVAARNPGALERLAALAGAYRDTRPGPGVTESTDPALDVPPETLEQLRALGYTIEPGLLPDR